MKDFPAKSPHLMIFWYCHFLPRIVILMIIWSICQMKRESFLKIRHRTTNFKYSSQPPTSGQARHLPFQRSSEIFFVKMDNVEEEQPDTLPGFKMQSENFVLKFVTGLQKGVCRYSFKKNSKSQFSTFCVQQAAWVRDRLVRHDGDPPQQARGWTCRPG